MSTKKQMQRLRSTSQYAKDKEFRKIIYFLIRTGWFIHRGKKESVKRFINPKPLYWGKTYQLNGFNTTSCRRKYKRHMRKVLESEKNAADWLKFGNMAWVPELIRVSDLNKEIKVMPWGV